MPSPKLTCLRSTDGNVGNRFSIDERTGALSARRLDRETRGSYRLEVTAQDRGSPARRDTCTINVRVQDQNDNDPLFQQNHYEVSGQTNIQELSRWAMVYTQSPPMGSAVGDRQDLKIKGNGGMQNRVPGVLRRLRSAVQRYTLYRADYVPGGR